MILLRGLSSIVQNINTFDSDLNTQIRRTYVYIGLFLQKIRIEHFRSKNDLKKLRLQYLLLRVSILSAPTSIGIRLSRRVSWLRFIGLHEILSEGIPRYESTAATSLCH